MSDSRPSLERGLGRWDLINAKLLAGRPRIAAIVACIWMMLGSSTTELLAVLVLGVLGFALSGGYLWLRQR